MAEAHPELAGKPTRIELRCAHIPETRALELLGHIHDQLAFQEIRLEVVCEGRRRLKSYKVTSVTKRKRGVGVTVVTFIF